MRISDWSSDVCSSDLRICVDVRPVRPIDPFLRDLDRQGRGVGNAVGGQHADVMAEPGEELRQLAQPAGRNGVGRWKVPGNERSEEHTSELQSLMRISYAVFCLKKKTH